MLEQRCSSEAEGSGGEECSDAGGPVCACCIADT